MDGIENGERIVAQGQERRAYPRYTVDEEITLIFVNHGMPIKGRMVELSLEGCRVRPYVRFTGKAGRPVEITFRLKGFAFRLNGVLRWSDSDRLLGIDFANMIPRRKAELAEVIQEMAAETARVLAADQPVVEQEASQPAHRNIPETPVVHPVEQDAASQKIPMAELQVEAPEVHRESEPPAHTPATPRDRREQMRHEVDNFATVFLVKIGSALRGRILDLSLSGCRIRTDERFPVGIYTRVEAEFHLEGLPFRLGGVIQAIHDRHTVGIRFLDVSQRKRQQVLELIDEIEGTREEIPADEPSPENGPAQ